MPSLLTMLAGMIAFLAPTAALTETAQSDISPRVDAVVDRALADHRIVGAVILIAQDGKIVYRRAAGFADRESGRPMGSDTIFRVASLSKPLVSAAALALVEEGKLSLDDPVTRWLPNFRPQLSGDATPKITIRQLLTHTAGLSYGFMEPSDGPYHRANVSDGLDQPGLTLDEELRRITTAGLAYAPGTAWRYSVAIDVLGAVLEKVTGKPLPEVVAERVTNPLGMTDTGFAVTDKARLATPYADGQPPIRMSDPYTLLFGEGAGIRYSPSRVFDPRSFPSGGAGMVGTAGDFMKFFEAIRNGGGGVVGPETARAMMTNQTGDLAINFGPGWGFGYGGAVLVDPRLANSPLSPGTWSWGGAYGQSWFVDPGRKITVVALTNTAVEGMAGAFARDLVVAVGGAR